MLKIGRCDDTPSAPVTSISSKPFQYWPVIIYWFQSGYHAFLPGYKNTIKGVGGKEQTNNNAWVSSKCKKKSYVTLHSLYICRLTLTWISSENSTKILGMLTHLDWSSLTAAELYLMPTGLFSVRCRLPFSVSRRQLTSFRSFVQLLTRVPLLTSGHIKDRGLRPLFGFATRQTKGSSA